MPSAYVLANLRKHSGKTTLAAHLAASWANRGHRGALLDWDPEGHLAQHLGIPALAGQMAGEELGHGPYGESVYRLEGDAPWRTHLTLFSLGMEDAFQLSAKTLSAFDVVLMDTPSRDRSCLLHALSLLWTLKRAGWRVQVVVPHMVTGSDGSRSHATLDFLNILHRQTSARIPVALVPLRSPQGQEPFAGEGIPNYSAGTLRFAPPLRYDPYFVEIARFGLTLFDLPISPQTVDEVEAIAHFLFPTA